LFLLCLFFENTCTGTYSNFRFTNDLIELHNLTLVADLIIRSAQIRRKSRGLHYTLDYPKINFILQNTILVPEINKENL